MVFVRHAQRRNLHKKGFRTSLICSFKIRMGYVMLSNIFRFAMVFDGWVGGLERDEGDGRDVGREECLQFAKKTE